MSQFTRAPALADKALRQALNFQPRWLSRATQLKILRKVGLMTQLERYPTQSVSKAPRRRFSAHDFVPQKTCVTRVGC
jgi:hypothetical protein